MRILSFIAISDLTAPDFLDITIRAALRPETNQTVRDLPSSLITLAGSGIITVSGKTLSVLPIDPQTTSAEVPIYAIDGEAIIRAIHKAYAGESSGNEMLHPEAAAVRDSEGEGWNEHALFSRQDWRDEVGEGNTQLSYYGWLSNQLTERDEEFSPTKYDDSDPEGFSYWAAPTVSDNGATWSIFRNFDGGETSDVSRETFPNFADADAAARAVAGVSHRAAK